MNKKLCRQSGICRDGFADRRAVMLGEYIVKNNATVRAAAAEFSVSKSTVHKDITSRLQSVDGALYSKVEAVLSKNKAERHLRGGRATKEKYRKISESDERKLHFDSKK